MIIHIHVYLFLYSSIIFFIYFIKFIMYFHVCVFPFLYRYYYIWYSSGLHLFICLFVQLTGARVYLLGDLSCSCFFSLGTLRRTFARISVCIRPFARTSVYIRTFALISVCIRLFELISVCICTFARISVYIRTFAPPLPPPPLSPLARPLPALLLPTLCPL